MSSSAATMMDVPLTIDLVVDRAERWNGNATVVSRRPDRALHRTTYKSICERSRKLARALVQLGLEKGDRVATLMWNHAEHLEAYFGIPLAGGVTHTLNLRLHPDDIAYIANDARDRFLIVDDVLLPLLDKVVAAGAKFERVFVVGKHGDHTAYEELIADGADDKTSLPTLAETDGLGTCYTSGTTGRPKGVVYSHRSTLLHTLGIALPDAMNLSRNDTLLPVVPMFHVNAWGLPFAAAMVGAGLVFPGPYLDPPNLLDLLAEEQVTVSAGVPTIWLGIREALDAAPDKWKLAEGLRMFVGGAAAPEQLIRDFDRLGMQLIHAWGMTETSPLGLVSRMTGDLETADEGTRYRMRAKQGRPPPLIDVRVRNWQGDVPNDDKTNGELLVRGPWVASRYSNNETPDRWTKDGWFRTGDVARVDGYGFVQLTDRVADMIKSGGEWIASQELENALMGHPAVREAAIVGVPHPKWSERPLAVVVLKPGASATPDQLREYLGPRFPKFWLPDEFVFIAEIPRTSAGKFKKTELRATYKDHYSKADS